MIVKIPYHFAVPKYFATTSEAATLTLLRQRNIPVPKAYGYCANAENPVGTEYLLLEKAPGVCLKTKWLDLTQHQIGKLAHNYVQIEMKLSEITFSATGSLCFRRDTASGACMRLCKGVELEEHKEFCFGPIADYMFWYGRRVAMDLNRGPWQNPVDYLKSIADKEIEWAHRYGKPIEPDFPYNAMGLRVQQPEDFSQLLRQYQIVTPHLLSKDPAHPFNRPILRHLDPTPGNIYINPDTSFISFLIDWQHAIVQPHILAAGYPRTIECSDAEAPTELKLPRLLTDLATLPPAEQAIEHEIHRRRLLFYFYRCFNDAYHEAHIATLHDPLWLGRQLLVDRAGRQ